MSSGLHPLVGEVGGGEGVAEIVGEGVGDHRGQAVVGGGGRFGKTKLFPAAHRHGRRASCTPEVGPSRFVLEHVEARARVEGDGADPPPNIGPRSGRPVRTASLRRAALAGGPHPHRRLGARCLARSICIGETVTSGAKLSSQSVRPRAGPRR